MRNVVFYFSEKPLKRFWGLFLPVHTALKRLSYLESAWENEGNLTKSVECGSLLPLGSRTVAGLAEAGKAVASYRTPQFFALPIR